jgi:hypothetical protein
MSLLMMILLRNIEYDLLILFSLELLIYQNDYIPLLLVLHLVMMVHLHPHHHHHHVVLLMMLISSSASSIIMNE